MTLEQWSETVRLKVDPLPDLSVIEDQAREYFQKRNGNSNVNKKMVKAFVRHQYTNYNKLVMPLQTKEDCGIAYITIKARLKGQIDDIVDRLYRQRLQ